MTFASYGDLASTFQTRHLTAQIKQDMARLGLELSTGRKTDMATQVSGDFGPVAGIEHSLKLQTAYAQSVKEAATILEGAQTVLGNIQDQVETLSGGLHIAIGSQNAGVFQDTGVDARERLSSVISNLNTSLGGRALFAGTATDGPALADASAILSGVMSAISGETTAAGIADQIDNWFKAPGGGFDTLGYLGSGQDLGPFRLRDGEVASQPVKANSPEIRDLLAALTKSAVMGEGVLTGDLDAQKDLASRSSNGLLNAIDDLTNVRANIGSVEARIEAASASNVAEKSALELSYNRLTAADPYETATALQALYDQMESLYTVTARLSNLTFTDYMR
ncbi:flagellar hook-associated protein 3 FlgL [Aliiroseovarius sediminilitoris]|uniref:Flagellar hook-associated protein 3 FlgL n=1 Tax=Aliiroseovarius sediminilitoris TaxID=1173584 RepID=A0A1I0MMR5_9RHOB|nr:flagellin [Aliiroseovarius sediminilitoris]SEV89466.1 flagellar hook-associated protein 3 FlgL [Aliiroseovarius sediminilitoris]